MNPQRMKDRAMRFSRILPGQLDGVALRFNKRAADAPWRSYANVVYSPGSVVEGVLYELDDDAAIFTMDPYEGAPRLYSREIYGVRTAEGVIPSWVYVANRAMISADLLPERWYLEHLLAGKEWLSEAYFTQLLATECQDG